MDKNKETFETWNNVASLYQDKFMHLDQYNESYDLVCSTIAKENAKILEIGCGPGNITRHLLTARPDFDIHGIDIAPNMIELAKKNNPAANFSIMDCRQISSLKTKYDGIIGGFCLPYLTHAEGKVLIANSFDLLNDNGLLYLSFVEGDPDRSGYKTGVGGRVYFNYYDLKKLREQLQQNKFEELKIFKVNYKTSEKDFEIHTILIAKKKTGLI